MISEKININNIVIDLNESDKKSVVEKLSKLLETNGFVSDHKQFQKDVFDRENHMTTGIGKNIAIPHGKSLAVIESTVAVAKLKRSVEWGALDDQPVDLVFLLAIKDTDKGTNHLRILAELSGRLMDDEFVKRIKDSRNKKELVKALSF
ncbi:TPA: PTS sugar transporter subunit IIA [Enterococcus faecium]